MSGKQPASPADRAARLTLDIRSALDANDAVKAAHLYEELRPLDSGDGASRTALLNDIRLGLAREAVRLGNNRQAQELLRQVLASSPEPDQRSEAESWLKRILPDRAALILGAVCFVIFVAVVWEFILHR
ncbi:MAG: hypothetical protein GMKNLPBB_01218 [Myxococcota bacterium]|nr:hypothetical protein [Myxococcota bacterium]